MKPSFWKQKTIVLTGASSGIGKSIALALGDIPCTIYGLARRKEEIPELPVAKMIPVSLDLGSEESVRTVSLWLLKETESSGIDVLFNNAGITAHGRFDETEISVIRKTFEVNFFGPVAMTQILLPSLRKNKGVITSTSTVSGLYGVPGRTAYSSSKSALHAAMEALRIEFLEEGVRSVIVCPPYTKTALRTSGLDAKGNILDEPQAHSKVKTPEEVAIRILDATEDPEARLITIDKTGWFVKWFRLLAPALLERILYRKLRKDF